jgi:hypothetical protein
MRRLFVTFLSAAAVCAVLSATPAAAQVAAKSGALHSQTRHSHRHMGSVERSYMTSLGYPFAWQPSQSDQGFHGIWPFSGL